MKIKMETEITKSNSDRTKRIGMKRDRSKIIIKIKDPIKEEIALRSSRIKFPLLKS